MSLLEDITSERLSEEEGREKARGARANVEGRGCTHIPDL